MIICSQKEDGFVDEKKQILKEKKKKKKKYYDHCYSYSSIG